MLFSVFSFFMIFVLCSLSIFAVIYNDVYNILKFKNKQEISIDMIRFEKCILPYKINSKAN